MKVGDMVRMTHGGRTYWRGLIISEGSLSRDNIHGKFLVHWFYPLLKPYSWHGGSTCSNGWECDFSLEVVSESR